MQREPTYNVALMTEDAAVKGWMPVDLIRAADVSIAHGYRFFRGESASPRTAKKLAKALGYSVRRYLISSRLEASA